MTTFDWVELYRRRESEHKALAAEAKTYRSLQYHVRKAKEYGRLAEEASR